MKFYYKTPVSKERLDKIRILAFDMDDTLLDHHGKLSDANRAAIMRAMEKGYHVVIATGRVLAALPKDVVAVEGVQYAITSNGARITDLHTGKVLLENLIAPEAVDAVDSYLHDEDVMLEIFFDDAVYADRKDLTHLADFGRTSEKSQEYVLSTRQPVDDLLGMLEANKDRMENINLIMADDEKRLRWLAELKQV
ncbi:MAG: HAD hydrolase family protein, partial [Firmicutes bacterium]|nr:HAD hydrolase family protein [Bacillota bacterium]